MGWGGGGCLRGDGAAALRAAPAATAWFMQAFARAGYGEHVGGRALVGARSKCGVSCRTRASPAGAGAMVYSVVPVQMTRGRQGSARTSNDSVQRALRRAAAECWKCRQAARIGRSVALQRGHGSIPDTIDPNIGRVVDLRWHG